MEHPVRLDGLIGHFVDQARRSGASWTLIGKSMGVTRQAARKRFVPKADVGLDPSRGSSRCTERARSAVTAAQEEARATGHAEIRTEHLALGLLTEPEALAAQAIVAQGVPLDTVRRSATAALPPAAAGEAPDLIPYDAGARKALGLTFREALRPGRDCIGTEHIPLALLEHEDGTGDLSGAGVDKAAAGAHITAAIATIVAARSGQR